MPGVGADSRVQQGHGDAVLAQLDRAEPKAAERDVGVAVRPVVLGLHQHVPGQADGDLPATAAGEVDVAGEPRAALQVDQGGPPVGGGHVRGQLGYGLAVGLPELVGEERVGLRVDAGPVGDRVGQPRLDGLLPAPLELDLERAVPRVEVGAVRTL